MNKSVNSKIRLIVISAVAVLLCGVAVFLLSGVESSAAPNDKYDKLIRSSSQWSARRTMKEADRHREKGDSARALVLYIAVVEQLAADKSPEAAETRVRACINQGDIYLKSGNYDNALKAYLKAQKISEEAEGEPHIATIYRNIASVYSLFRDYNKKVRLEESGLKKACQYGDTATMKVLLNSLARGCVALHKPKNARRYYEMFKRLDGDASPTARYHRDYTEAMVVRTEGKVDEALRRFQDLAARADRAGVDPKYKCSVYNELYWIYKDKNGRQDSAGYYLRHCIDIVKENGLELMFMDEIKELSQFYKSRGDNASAMKWKLEYLELADSAYISNVRNLNDVQNREFVYEMDKVETQINTLYEEKRHQTELIARQRWIILCSVLGVIIASLVIWYIILQNRKISESYRSLYSLNKSLSDTHRETSAIRRELEKENGELRRQLAECVASASSARQEGENAEPEGAEGEKSKYSSSSLGDEHGRQLARRIMEVLDGDDCVYCDSDFSLAVLAEKVGSNIKYVSQVINDVFGKNFTQYINEYRIREACDRLSGREPYDSYSIKGIGESVGFKSHSTFVGVFKKITGMTPSVYKKMADS